MPNWNEWDSYGTGPRAVRDGLKPKNERGAIGESWWSKRWIGVLESFGIGSRLTKGRSYARKGQVVSLDVTSGLVTAKVQGSQPRPYSVKIRLDPLSAIEWDKVIETLAGQAIFAAKLLSGEMPQNIEEAFGVARVALFPTDLDELDTDCTCPDWANPCKHVAAVYYLLADRFDADPFLIFKLRGRGKEEIIQRLREKRASLVQVETEIERGLPISYETTPTSKEHLPLEESLLTFWGSGEDLESFSFNLAPSTIEYALLRRLGPIPVKENPTEVTIFLQKIYQLVREAAQQKVDGEF